MLSNGALVLTANRNHLEMARAHLLLKHRVVIGEKLWGDVTMRHEPSAISKAFWNVLGVPPT